MTFRRIINKTDDIKIPGIFLLMMLFIFFVIPSAVYSQAEQSVRSKNRVILEGKIYYIHVVKQGETLNSLCQAYKTTSKVITDENPAAIEGIHEGQVLKIPESQPIVEIPKQIGSDTGLFHIVQAGQTLYSISKLYNITVEELTRNNPEVKYSSIQVNQVLKIPRSKPARDSVKINPLNEAGYIIHKVEPRQTLFSLARQYNISMDDIRQANLVNGEWKGLKIGDMLKIPIKDAKHEKVIPAPVTKDTVLIPVDSSKKIIEPVQKCNCDSIALFNHPGPYSIAMVLPFSLDQIELEAQVDTLQLLENEEENRPQEALRASASKKSAGWVEFYQGSLLALEKVKKQNISVSLNVYDSQSSPAKYAAVLKEIENLQPSFIVAAGDSGKIASLSALSKLCNIPLALPTATYSKLIAENPYILAFEPGDEVEIDRIANLLETQKEVNIVVIHSSDSMNIRLASELHQKVYDAMKLDTSRLHVVQYNENKIDQIINAIRDSISNIAVVLTKKEEITIDVLRSIHNASLDRTVSLIGLHDLSKFNSLDIGYLHNLELQYFIPFHYNPAEEKIRQYTREFTRVNQYYPYRTSSAGFNYGMLGYDLIHYLTSALFRYQKDFINCLQKFQSENLLGRFYFVPVGKGGGLENQNELLFRFTKDFNIIRVDQPCK